MLAMFSDIESNEHCSQILANNVRVDMYVA